MGYSLAARPATRISQPLVPSRASFYPAVSRPPAGIAAQIIFVVGLLGAFV
ncbi:MFS transporter, partial [Pseudoxanthomonas taiwanensis]